MDQSAWFGVYVVACITIIVVILGYNVWAERGITGTIRDANVRRISAVAFWCSPDHFWGHTVYYDELGKPTAYGHEKMGNACIDWKTGKWILNSDYAWQSRAR